MSDDRLGPCLDGFALFSPILFLGVPHAHLFKPQGRQVEGLHIDPGRLDLAGKIRMTAVTPLFSWPDRDGLRAG